jgi:hypothetical protein
MAEERLMKLEFRSYAANLGLKCGRANLPIGGLLDAILDDGVPGMAVHRC